MRPRNVSVWSSSQLTGRVARLAAALSLLVFGSTAAGQCRYVVTDVIERPPCPGTAQPGALAVHFGPRGEVVGRYLACGLFGNTEAFVWHEGVMTTITRPPGITSARAVAISASGIVVGECQASGFGRRGFLMIDGEWTLIHPVIPGGQGSAFTDISPDGIAVGYRNHAHGTNAFRWEDGVITDIDATLGIVRKANAVNSFGAICGEAGHLTTNGSAFIWSGDDITDIGPVPGGISSVPHAINDIGYVASAGFVQTGTGPIGMELHPYVWDGSAYQPMAMLPGTLGTGITGMNNLKQVVGVAEPLEPGASIGTISQKGMTVALDDIADWPDNFNKAMDVDDQGRILATAAGRGVILVPIDRPAGDIDIDCRVDQDDLLLLLQHWGPTGASIIDADLNDDEDVNVFDLLLLLSTWGVTG